MDTPTSVAREALRSIAVKVELSSGNIEPLLHEVRHALSELLREGRSSVIDLKGIPLAAGEEEELLRKLGSGEVRATLSVFGSSEIAETAFPGVWVVTHRDEQGVIQGRFVEITRVPEILCSQIPDVADGLERLCASLELGTGR
jgi:hydrogenase-1 operon protein HyaF